MTANLPDRFILEILGQPAAMRRAGQAIEEQVAALAALAASIAPAQSGGRPLRVLLTGMGGSLDACRAVLPELAAGGVAAFEVEAAELAHARRGLISLVDLVVLVSQSGRSAEALRLAAEIRDAGRPALCVLTNESPNPLADLATTVLATRAGPEEAPSSASFTTSLLALGAVAAVLRGIAPARAARDAASIGTASADAMATVLQEHESLTEAWRSWLGPRRSLFVLGRGAAAAAAGMGALILKEASSIHAEAMSGAAFRHGPLEQAGPETAVALVSLDRSTAAFDAGLAADLLAAGSPVAWVGPAGSAPPGTFDCPVRAISGPAANAPAMVPFQLLAWRLSSERGTAGMFRHAGKVTTKE
jgi:glucosamine--fructose-6-phosphate aminotransferase (isomerizing)